MSIADNIVEIRKRIEAAALDAGRDDGADVELVAVSKTQPQEKLMEALAAGQRVFGENRVQEAQEHWSAYASGEASPFAKASEGKSQLQRDYPGLRLHLIGPLQTNKAKEAVALFDVIETLDREKLARKLADEMAKQGRDLPCYIQVNTGDEPQKAGISPAELPRFYDFCYSECGLDIVGLMCIPPVDEPPALHFALLAKLAGELGLSKLSMGMSADYERAVALGATSVRVGTGVFGERTL